MQTKNTQMKWSQSIIYVSAASYLGALIMVLMGYPLISGYSQSFQILYMTIGMLFCISSIKYRKLGYFMGIVYGIGAIMCFSGLQTWINYSGDLSLGPYMAVWDIVLGIALLDNLETPQILQ